MTKLTRLPSDIYSTICEYLVDCNNFRALHKVLFIFKNNKDFCKDIIFRFRKTYKHKINKAITNLYFSKNKDEIIIENTRGSFRRKLYPVALYHGYIWSSEVTAVGSRFRRGKSIEDILRKMRPLTWNHQINLSEKYTYDELERNKIHNLEYFILVKEDKNPNKNEYQVISHEISDYGITYECKNVTLRKIII